MSLPLPSSYTALAKYYDDLMSDYNYLAIRDYISKNIPKGKGLDIACGTGRLTIELAKIGYNMTGIDNSPNMLDKAIELGVNSGVSVPFILGDMNQLVLNGKYSFALLMCDAINYIDKVSFVDVMENIYLNLKDNGQICLEFSTKEKIINIIGNNTLLQDYDDLTIIWDNRLYNDYVKMDLIIFEKEFNNKFIRSDETHVQYIYELEETIDCLIKIGYEIKDIIDSKTYNSHSIDTDRIIIRAGK